MQNLSLISVILLSAVLFVFPPVFAALLARICGRRPRPDSQPVTPVVLKGRDVELLPNRHSKIASAEAR
jgi:hypothetical protein